MWEPAVHPCLRCSPWTSGQPFPRGSGLDGVSDCSPVYFQALLQKRSTSVITTWSSSPICHVGRRTGEGFHPPPAQTSSQVRSVRLSGGEAMAMLREGVRGAPCSRRLLPEILFIALGFVRRWLVLPSAVALALLRPREPLCSRIQLWHGRTGSLGRAAFSYKDFKGLILSFYVLPDCKFLNFLYSL